MPDGERVTTGSEPRRWRTQTHTIPAQVGGAVECYGLGVYPGPIAYLAFPSWADDVVAVPHIGLLPGQVDALLNALEDARMCFAENGVEVVEPGHDEQTEDLKQVREAREHAVMYGYELARFVRQPAEPWVNVPEEIRAGFVKTCAENFVVDRARGVLEKDDRGG